jgi:hypothetical protein
MPDKYVCQKQITKRVVPSQKAYLEKQIPVTAETVPERFNLATAPELQPGCSQSL